MEQDQQTKVTELASKFKVSMTQNKESSKVSIVYYWATAFKADHEVKDCILQIIVNHFFIDETQANKEAGVSVTGFTKFTWTKITYRANPCYKKEKAWFDWVLVAWTIPAGTSRDVAQDPNYPSTIELPFEQNRVKKKVRAMLFPAKVIAFIEDKNNKTYA